MLTLPIKKKWFDMIKSGEKKEEYREIKPYYVSRFYSNYIAGGGGLNGCLIIILKFIKKLYLEMVIEKIALKSNAIVVFLKEKANQN